MHGGEEQCIQSFEGNARKKKRLVAIPRCRWEDNIKIDLREIGCRGMDWIDMAQDRYQWMALVNIVMNLWIP
jgi:hypothetical protein